ncbi:hypothetical protein GCM10022420_013270 [Streptomyces iranensis]
MEEPFSDDDGVTQLHDTTATVPARSGDGRPSTPNYRTPPIAVAQLPDGAGTGGVGRGDLAPGLAWTDDLPLPPTSSRTRWTPGPLDLTGADTEQHDLQQPHGALPALTAVSAHGGKYFGGAP